MAEEENNLLNALVTEYIRKVAPETARIFQSFQSSVSAAASFRLEDAVQHFSRTVPSRVRQLDSRKRRSWKVIETHISGEKKVFRAGFCILNMVFT